MSRKFNFIPFIPNYEWVKKQMQEDLKYRLESRLDTTIFGRPLYFNPNVQVVITQECPYCCPFCLERQYPMMGNNDFEAQQNALRKVLAVHPTARLSITGGEPGLYEKQIKALVDIYKTDSEEKFCVINTTGYNPAVAEYGKINLSVNEYIKPNLSLFPDAVYQTVLGKKAMNLPNIKRIMDNNIQSEYSFRFLTEIDKQDYDISVLNDVQDDPECDVSLFRVGDFFLYAVFIYHGKKARFTLGDMYQQMHNDYRNGYSNLIVHPDGRIGLNWK